ncbi:MAG: type II secretion system protein GspM [Gammaproteobacteria bacterium]
MASEISPGVHKIVALALLLTLLAAFWGVVFKPLIALDKKAVNALEDARFELSRSRRLVEELAHLSQTDLQNRQETLTSLLVWTTSDTNQETAMQAIVDKLIQISGMSLESFRVANTSVHGSLSRVSVDLKGEGDEAALVAFMAAIETNRPLLVIDQMTVQILTTEAVVDRPPAVTRLVVEFRLAGFGALLTETPVRE